MYNNFSFIFLQKAVKGEQLDINYSRNVDFNLENIFSLKKQNFKTVSFIYVE